MKRTTLSRVILPLLIFGTSAFSGNESAVETKQVEPLAESWQFNLGVPLWLTGIEGQLGVLGKTVGVDVGPSPIIRHVNLVASFSAEARKGPLGFYTDFLYLDDRAGVSTKGLVSSLALRVDEYLADAEVNWRVIDRPWGWLEVRAGSPLGCGSDGETAGVDLGSQARPGTGGGFAKRGPVVDRPSQAHGAAKDRPDFRAGTEPHVFAGRGLARSVCRIGGPLYQPFYLTAKGDVGGFGVGSKLTWQGYGALGCQFTRRVYSEVGYRYLYVDYQHAGFIYDTATRGAQITMGVIF